MKLPLPRIYLQRRIKMGTVYFIRSMVIAVFLASLLAVIWTAIPAKAVAADGGNKKLDIYDNCDPRDPAWNTVGGCFLDPREGDVTFAEFGRLLLSPLSTATVGHPSWRFEPTYLRIDAK